MNDVIQFIRASIRPILTLIFAAVIAQLVIEGIEAPAWFLGLAIPCISWWFIDRSLLHRKEANNGV